MWLFFKTIFTLSTLISSSLYQKKSQPSTNIFKLTAELDESELQRDIYKPGNDETESIIQVNKVSNGDDFSFEIRVDSKAILAVIEDAAQSAGLLNGETRFEKLKEQNNLFVSYMLWLNGNFEIYEKQELKRLKLLDALSPKDYLTSENEYVTFTPTAKADYINLSFNWFWPNNLRFVVKDKVEYGYYRISSVGSNSFDLLNIMAKPGQSVTSDEYIKIYGDFLNKLWQNWFEIIPSSNTWDIVKANQNSEEFKLTKGFNIKIKNETIAKKLPINPWLLLLPLFIFLLPIIYFALKKRLRK